MPKGFNAGLFLFNVIWVSNPYDMETIRHEYGHFLQKKTYGTTQYILKVLIPSLKGYWTYRLKGTMTIDDYLKQPWEAEADKLGGNKFWDGEKWHEPIY